MTPATSKAEQVHAVRALIAAGQSEVVACRVAGVHRCTYRRWAEAFDEGGVDALHDGTPTGRPPVVVLDQAEADCLRQVYIRSNLREGAGSMSGAARLAARDPATCLKPETRAAILAKRASKHALPVEVRRAVRATPATVRHYRDEDALRLGGIHAAGALRMVREPDGSLRRLRPGERQSWDDGSVNFLVVVPWPRGGDVCSERYGVRVARFQLLAGIDDSTDFCVGWSYIMRMQDSYRAEDVCATLHASWSQGYVPESIVLEGGAWQALRTLELVRAAGARVIDAKGRPRGKLIEGWWNRLWTVLAMRANGQIGRYRGEMSRENDLWMRCRAGRADPREHFPRIETALEAMEWSVGFLNSDPIESREYGNWVPCEKHAAGLAAQSRPALPAGLDHYALRERHDRRVRRDGITGATAISPLGYPYTYLFQDDGLLAYEGARVWVHFDPWTAPVQATCTLAEPFRGAPAGTVVCQRATCLNAAPELLHAGGKWQVCFADHVSAANAARQRAHAYVRQEQRVLSADGSRVARTSRDNAGVAGVGVAPALPETITAPPEADPMVYREQVDFDALEAAAGVVAKTA
jgi:hypothetical protein